MKRERIEQLAALLPPDAEVFTSGRQSGAALPGLAERLAVALNAPNFGSRLIMHFVSRREALPPSVHESWLRRAYSHHAGKNLIPDTVMLAVEQFAQPVNEFVRDVLVALLICRDITCEEIAEHLSLNFDTVRCFEQLHFNVRDRVDEAAYIARLVFPQGRFQSLKTDGIDEMEIAQRLLVAAHQTGWKDVLWLAGLDKRQDPPSVEEELQTFEQAILQNAVQLARSSGLNSKVAPGISHAKSLLAASRNSPKTPVNAYQFDHTLGSAVLKSLNLTGEEYARELEAADARLKEAQEFLRGRRGE